MKKQIPAFESEKQEAEWWDAHSEEHQEAMAEAIRQGRAITLEQALERSRPKQTSSILMLMDAEDADLAQEQAQAKGVGYETYLTMLLHEALQHEAARTRAS